MKLLTYRIGENEKVGVLTSNENGIHPIDAFDLNFKTMLEVINNITVDDMKMIRKKMSMDTVAPFDYIESHSNIVKDLDYEAELAVVIGKKAYKVKAEDAEDYVFGYTIVNDVSARTIQLKHKQWYFGKSLDGFTPMGPSIVTADEFAFPPKLKLQCKVNGELRQNITTDRMIHTIPEVIEELSYGMTLLPGTIIVTGTPSGVGLALNPPKPLKSGDIVECIVEGIGKLSNEVR